MPSLARWIGLSLLSLGLLALSASLRAQTHKKVQEIVIHSGWGGLGTPQDLTVTILATRDGFQRDGQAVKPALVKALVSAAEVPTDLQTRSRQFWDNQQLASVAANACRRSNGREDVRSYSAPEGFVRIHV